MADGFAGRSPTYNGLMLGSVLIAILQERRTATGEQFFGAAQGATAPSWPGAACRSGSSTGTDPTGRNGAGGRTGSSGTTGAATAATARRGVHGWVGTDRFFYLADVTAKNPIGGRR